MRIEGLLERTEYIDIFFPPITQSRSVSDVLFTGGRGVSDFSVLTRDVRNGFFKFGSVSVRF